MFKKKKKKKKNQFNILGLRFHAVFLVQIIYCVHKTFPNIFSNKNEIRNLPSLSVSLLKHLVDISSSCHHLTCSLNDFLLLMYLENFSQPSFVSIEKWIFQPSYSPVSSSAVHHTLSALSCVFNHAFKLLTSAFLNINRVIATRNVLIEHISQIWFNKMLCLEVSCFLGCLISN